MTAFYWYALAFIVVTAVAVVVWIRPAIREKKQLEQGHNSMATRKQEAREDIAEATGGSVSPATEQRLGRHAEQTAKDQRRAV